MSNIERGVIVDIRGLSFGTDQDATSTSEDGTFDFEANTEVSFWIGSLKLGTTINKKVVTFLDLAAGPQTVDNPGLINRLRLLMSLSDQQGFEQEIVITNEVKTVVSKFAEKVDLDCSNTQAMDDVLSEIGSEIGVAPKTVPHARNHLRRALAGFKVLRDIKIPTRDGNFLFADLYLPLHPVEKYPVVVGYTTYGKRVVYSGPDVSNAAEVAEFERAEDSWHSTPAMTDPRVPNTTPVVGRWSLQRRFESVGTFNTFLWVPRGYAMLKVDPRGTSQTPGTRFIAEEEATDLCDAVEWASTQPWSTGSVGLGGNSNGANTQWGAAQLKPKGLKCFMPYATDIDTYREVAFVGGISLGGYLLQWLDGVRKLSPKWGDTGRPWELMDSHPFDDTYWEEQNPKLEAVDIPVLTAASQVALVHSRGAYEVWRRVKSEHKYLQIVDGNYYSWPNHEVASKVLAFADRFLKGIETDLEPVGVQMRLGHKQWYWRTELDWTIPGTEYVKWYLQADKTLDTDVSINTKDGFEYSAEAKPTTIAGVSFTSSPLKEDLEIAGHSWAKLYISSSNADADVVVLVWALDEHGKVVSFCVRDAIEPLNSGALRASHRKLDEAKSLSYRPYQTHARDDYAPLKTGEIVELDIELFPATARIEAGWSIRVDICPSEAQPNITGYVPRPYKVWPDEIHNGATNTLHVGPEHRSYIALPKVPLRDLKNESQLKSVEY